MSIRQLKTYIYIAYVIYRSSKRKEVRVSEMEKQKKRNNIYKHI